MSQEIQLYRELPTMFPAIKEAGIAFAKSGLFGCTQQEQGIVLAMECVAQCAAPSQILRRWNIVEGKLSLKTAAALADFRQNGGDHDWHELGDIPKAAGDANHYAEATFTDPKGRKLKYRYSIADAKVEGIYRKGSRWEKRPGSMLRARATSNALMALCPELYAGTEDENDDSPAAGPALNLTAPPTVPAAAHAPAPAPAPAKPPVTIDVKVEPVSKTAPLEDTAELAKQGLAPTAKTEPTPAPAATTPAASGFDRADADTLQRLELGLASHRRNVNHALVNAALAFIRRNAMVKPSEGWEHLTQKAAMRIVNNLNPTGADKNPDGTLKSDSFAVAVLGSEPQG